jgi:hypothetical protein
MTQQKRIPTRILVISVAVLVVIAILFTFRERIMGTTQAGDPRHELPRTMVAQLFDQSPTLQQADGVDNLYFLCTALEGSLCYFVPAEAVAEYDFTFNSNIQNATNQIERDLAFQILGELDVKHVERAKNNTVLLHCQRDGGGNLSCTINGGNSQWYPVTLT